LFFHELIYVIAFISLCSFISFNGWSFLSRIIITYLKKGYCTQTKTLFQGMIDNPDETAAAIKIHDVQIHELDRRPDGSAIQQALEQMTGQRTVPSVFVHGQHVGGNDDTRRALQSGKLQDLLRNNVPMPKQSAQQ
jgi:glutaredoxin 3